MWQNTVEVGDRGQRVTCLVSYGEGSVPVSVRNPGHAWSLSESRVACPTLWSLLRGRHRVPAVGTFPRGAPRPGGGGRPSAVGLGSYLHFYYNPHATASSQE